MTAGQGGWSPNATNIAARRRLIAAASRWQRPAVVITNLEAFPGLQTARLMRRHDIPVIALSDQSRAPLCHTRSVEAVFDAGLDGADTVRVLEWISASFPQRPVLIPCADTAVAAVSVARDRLDYHLVLPDHAIIESLTDKSRFLTHCSAIGVPVSPYRLLRDRADALAASTELRYPVVMKPYRSTPDWENHLGRKAFRVFEPARILELWDRAEPKYPVLLQEWVEGEDDQLYSCNAYYASDGRCLVTFVARKLRQWPPHTGRSSLGVECRNDEVLDAASRLFGSMPYRGFAYLEMKRDARTGTHYAIEANIGRPTGRSPIAEAGGVELHYTAYCDALGIPLPQDRIQHYRRAKWIYFAHDAVSAYYYWRRGELTLRDWLRSLRGIRADAVFAWRDPLPFVLDALAGLRSVMGRDPLD